MREKVPGPVVRDRGARLRQIGTQLSSRFTQAQVGTIRPGLTLEDGSLVVTDNYLKIRIAPGLKRNERVRVRVTSAGSGVVVAAGTSG
jgi:tRNA A37 methylthiotransferase MiaB